MQTVLVVDDEPNIVALIQLYLGNAGYGVLVARDGEQALRLARTEHPSLMILDLMLPEADGFEVCRRLRQGEDDLPIIMLTARDDDVDKIVGLELGADDYVTKPFNPRELVARVKAVLRRTEKTPVRSVLTIGDVTLSEVSRQVSVDQRTIRLRPKEFDLLTALMENVNIALSRERLLEMVWGYDFCGDTRTIDVHIARLREKLEGGSVRIETVWGIGYKLVER